MQSRALLLVILASTSAHADAAADRFDRTVDAMYASTTAQRGCPDTGCHSVAVRKRRLAGGALVEVRRGETATEGSVYEVMLRQHGRWRASFLAIRDESCGAGHCVQEKVIELSAKRVGAHWRVTVRKESRRVDNDCTPPRCGALVSESDVVVDL